MFICLFLHSLLGVDQVLTEKASHYLSLLKPVFQVRNSTCSCFRDAKMSWRAPIQGLKWSTSRVERRIIPELCEWEPAKPLGWTGVNRATKKIFQALIQSFSLPIRLRVIRGAHHQLSISKHEQLLPEAARENLVTIRDDAMRKSMELVNVISENCGNLESCERVLEGQKVCILG